MFLCSRSFLLAVLLSSGFVACMVQPLTAQAPLPRHKLVQRALADISFDWQRHNTRHFQLYAPADSCAGAHLPALGKRAEKALAANLQLLGGPTYPRLPIYLVFVGSRPEMTRLVGQPAGGYAEPAEDSAFFVASPSGSHPTALAAGLNTDCGPSQDDASGARDSVARALSGDSSC
jgi:hypothetical protein